MLSVLLIFILLSASNGSFAIYFSGIHLFFTLVFAGLAFGMYRKNIDKAYQKQLTHYRWKYDKMATSRWELWSVEEHFKEAQRNLLILALTVVVGFLALIIRWVWQVFRFFYQKIRGIISNVRMWREQDRLVREHVLGNQEDAGKKKKTRPTTRIDDEEMEPGSFDDDWESINQLLDELEGTDEENLWTK